MKEFHIEIVTPDGLAYKGEVTSVLVRAVDGDLEILAGHTDILAPLSTGRARLVIDGKIRYASVNSGFLSVRDGEVKLCAITFEFAEDIDLNRARLAKEKAEAAIASAKDERALRLAKAKLMRAASRIKVAEGK